MNSNKMGTGWNLEIGEDMKCVRCGSTDLELIDWTDNMVQCKDCKAYWSNNGEIDWKSHEIGFCEECNQIYHSSQINAECPYCKSRGITTTIQVEIVQVKNY